MHGQRCTCALKSHTLDPVPETGLPLPQPAVLPESKRPQLTSTKSESTLNVFRDGHQKPAHRHNDMAHKCGLPYTVPRSHTIHSTSDARRSVDHLPMLWEDLPERLPEQPAGEPQRRSKSEQDSPEITPVTSTKDAMIPGLSLDPSSLFPCAPSARPAVDESNEGSSTAATVSTTFGGNPLDPIVTSVPPVDAPFSFSTANTSPAAQMTLQDSYPETYFASPDTDLQLGSAGFSAPPVDWSSFPLHSSDIPAPTSTKTPSFASFDYNSVQPGMPPPSSSGDLSEVDEFGPLPGLGNSSSDLHDLHSVSEGPEMDQFRISSASSFAGLPQTQLLASDNLDSIDIDDFLKTANESTAALEHQLQTSIGMESKQGPEQNHYAMSQAEQDYGQQATATASLPVTASPDTIWPSNDLFGAGPTMNGNFFPQSWSQ